jgi:hypothetical protein
VAQRLHALVNRTLERLDTLERGVEDPDLLGGLFGVDHLVTQFRRQVENLAVLGGAVPRRINKPVPLPTVFRQSGAEIEQFSRVRVIQPPEGTLHGYAAAEVVHLLAELIENAARFSPPDTQVTLRAQHVPAGLAIEIDDRGRLSMSAEKLQRMNQLLSAPENFDIRKQVEDGQIGLYVVAQIARRHQIRVVLQGNIFGGTQAVVVVPRELLGEATDSSTMGSHADESTGDAPVGVPARTVEPSGTTRTNPAETHGGPVRHIGTPAGTALESDSANSALPRRRTTQRSKPWNPSDNGRQAPAGDTRPALPRRSETYDGADFSEPVEANRQAVPPNPELMARFTSGLRRAKDTPTDTPAS